MPSIHGLELSPGDELGTATPDCCDEEMTASDSGYRCGDCGTVVTVSPRSGLVFDITT